MFNILLLRVLILLIGVGIAAYTDYKTGYIYNWLNYTLAVIGLIINIFTYSWAINLNIILSSIAIFVIGYIIYYFGKMGGGDIKLFIAINLLLPYYFNQPFILFVIISASLLSVVIISISYIIKLAKKIKFTKGFLKKKMSKIFRSSFLFIFFSLFIDYSIRVAFLPYYLYISIIPIFLGLFIIVFEDEIKRYIYLEELPLNKIEDGDVLAIEHVSKDFLNKLKLGNRQVIEDTDLKRFKKLGIKTLPIYYNLPRFGPYILLGTIFTLVFFLLI